MSIWNKVYLKELTKEDLHFVLNWRNQEFIRNVMYNNQIITMEQHIDWFNNLQYSKNQCKVFYFDHKPYGIVNINKIDLRNGNCQWGFYIGEKEYPPGLGTILGYLACEYIFNQLNLKKIYAEVLEFNHKSLKFHTKLGFEVEGPLKDHVYKEQRFVNVILFSLYQAKWTMITSEIKADIERKFN